MDTVAELKSRIEKLTECILLLVAHHCDCDTSIDKETGLEPPPGPDRQTNSWGEPVWGDRCLYCCARQLVTIPEARQ